MKNLNSPLSTRTVTECFILKMSKPLTYHKQKCKSAECSPMLRFEQLPLFHTIIEMDSLSVVIQYPLISFQIKFF